MIHPIDTPIEFEVSIGNYGNKLDTNVPAQSSTTPPSNPLFDGRQYHYLPWFEQKPCVVVDSQWEDCTFRITSMNILYSMADKLETGLVEVKKEMSVELYDIDAIKSQLGDVLDDFIGDVSQGLPQLPDKEVTKLDRLRRGVRVKELKELERAAIYLRNSPVKLEDMVDECEDYINSLRNLAIEPQQCIPDVIVWMLAGRKRVACIRIPAHKLFYADGKGRGQLCSKVQTLFLAPPTVEEDEDLEDLKDGAQVRMMLWLEMEKEKSHFAEEVKLIGGDFAVYAETYENEACLLGRWGTIGLTRPNWSDSRGKIKQSMDAFDPPPHGWSWDGPWFQQPELSTMFDMDESRDEWMEEIYENQARYPLSSWPDESKSYWTNVTGDAIKENDGKEEKEVTKDQLQCPEGWLWKSDWQVDIGRAVDDEGWEYAIEAGMGNWVPYERNGYLFRRRRWVRMRIRDKNAKVVQKKKQKREAALKEGWEYARLAHLTYHITRHPLDFARRRRYLRKLTGDPRRPAIFHFKGKERKKKKDDDDEEVGNQQVPRIFVTFSAPAHTYQLRAYIYQARDMYGGDKSGLSDPYCLVSFHTSSDRTRVISETVCPTWDQTILMKSIRIFGDTSKVVESPPPIIIEFMDKDTVGRDEFIGRTEVRPVIRLSLDTPGPRLDWFPIVRYNKYGGELLAAFELLLDEGNELPFTPPTASPPHTHYIVPSGIRPILQKNRVEILCWGVRDMKRFQLLPVMSPLVEFECGGVAVKSKPIKNTKSNPNFPDPVLSFDVLLPKEELYAPPLNIRVMDKRSFGRCPLVGTHVVKCMRSFIVEPKPSQSHKLAVAVAHKVATPTPSIYEGEVTVVVEDVKEALDSDPDSQKKVEFDWWSKYYYSIDDPRRTQQEYIDEGYDKMKIYPNDLEESFNKFEDLAQTFHLYRGKGSRDPEELAGESVGLLKGSLKVYPLPDDGSKEPPPVFSKTINTKPVECVVRLYVIRAVDLMAQDPDGKSDPYIKVKVGKGGKGKKIADKDGYIPSNLNPIFGKMFELKAHLPIDHTLTVTVMDWDRFSADDLIGETKIDLENRFISRHRATCGLPDTFCKRGVNKWRDRELPIQILEDWCKMMDFNPPEWSPDKKKVVINHTEYSLDRYEHDRPLPEDDLGDKEQRLALYVIKEKCNFVPEHIEERTLYNPIIPHISMGTLHMWVDIFPKEGALPPPVDISPRKPDKFVLRVVVFNTKDVLLDEISVVTGDAMSDIYVKGWIRGQDDTQKTDVHYRSMDGEGNFNWRMVFPFEYLPPEQVIVIKKKQHFYSLTKTEVHVAPRLTLQVWDNDLFSPDDFIGTIDFNLIQIPEPVQEAIDCSVDQLPPEEEVDDDIPGTVEAAKKRKASSDITGARPLPQEESEGLVAGVHFRGGRERTYWQAGAGD
ncbi:Myoferlin [Geodia barretti]|nr:Myoferlin [Geodia barretti]